MGGGTIRKRSALSALQILPNQRGTVHIALAGIKPPLLGNGHPGVPVPLAADVIGRCGLRRHLPHHIRRLAHLPNEVAVPTSDGVGVHVKRNVHVRLQPAVAVGGVVVHDGVGVGEGVQPVGEQDSWSPNVSRSAGGRFSVPLEALLGRQPGNWRRGRDGTSLEETEFVGTNRRRPIRCSRRCTLKSDWPFSTSQTGVIVRRAGAFLPVGKQLQHPRALPLYARAATALISTRNSSRTRPSTTSRVLGG